MNEYTKKDTLSPATAGESGDFRLIVRSKTLSLTEPAPAVAKDDALPLMAKRSEHPNVESSTVENRTTASITVEDGRLTLCYEDSISSDEPPVPTLISFSLDDPGMVTLERRGFLRSLMIFEEKKRHRATYRTPFAGFEMTVFSRKVENNLTPDGGKLVLSYCVEFKGAAEQKVELEIEAARM